MAQLHRSRKSSESPKTPRPQTSPTFGQLLQGDPSSPACSFSPPQGRQRDQHEDINHNNKKSVLAKVKERARKLRYSLSGRIRHGSGNHDNNPTTPPWGVSLHEDEEDDENPEYLGAPKLAPVDYKEAARQHPRGIHNLKNQSSASCTKHKVHFEDDTVSADKHITQTMSENLAPSSSEAVSDATHTGVSKLPGLTFTDPNEQETKSRNREPIAGPEVISVENLEKSSEKTERSTNSPQKWDKGVSVKEYFVQKFEPGEDERALSHVISEAISPRKKSFPDIGVVGKVREAVSSFLWPEQPSRLGNRALNSSLHNASSSAENAVPLNSNLTINTVKSPEVPIPNSMNTSPAIPISTHAQEEIEEQNHGRILQAN